MRRIIVGGRLNVTGEMAGYTLTAFYSTYQYLDTLRRKGIRQSGCTHFEIYSRLICR